MILNSVKLQKKKNSKNLCAEFIKNNFENYLLLQNSLTETISGFFGKIRKDKKKNLFATQIKGVTRGGEVKIPTIFQRESNMPFVGF